MADALGTPGGIVSDEEHRIAMAGMIAPQTSSLAVRTGVLWGPGTTALVTGTAAMGTMTYGIALHHAVTTRGTADGVYLGPNLEAATTVATTAAPGANSRIDVIWVKQNDLGSSVTPDSGTTAPLYGVTQGTAAASPVKPSIPVGAEELATATVAVGATSTNGAGVTITNTARQTVARGAPIPVRNQAERDALTKYAFLTVDRLDTGDIEMVNLSNAWVTVYSASLPASLTMGKMWRTAGFSAALADNVFARVGFDTARLTGGFTFNDAADTLALPLDGFYQIAARGYASAGSGYAASYFVQRQRSAVANLDVLVSTGNSKATTQDINPYFGDLLPLKAADTLLMNVRHNGSAAGTYWGSTEAVGVMLSARWVAPLNGATAI